MSVVVGKIEKFVSLRKELTQESLYSNGERRLTATVAARVLFKIYRTKSWYYSLPIVVSKTVEGVRNKKDPRIERTFERAKKEVLQTVKLLQEADLLSGLE